MKVGEFTFEVGLPGQKLRQGVKKVGFGEITADERTAKSSRQNQIFIMIQLMHKIYQFLIQCPIFPGLNFLQIFRANHYR